MQRAEPALPGANWAPVGHRLGTGQHRPPHASPLHAEGTPQPHAAHTGGSGGGLTPSSSGSFVWLEMERMSLSSNGDCCRQKEKRRPTAAKQVWPFVAAVSVPAQTALGSREKEQNRSAAQPEAVGIPEDPTQQSPALSPRWGRESGAEQSRGCRSHPAPKADEASLRAQPGSRPRPQLPLIRRSLPGSA